METTACLALLLVLFTAAPSLPLASGGAIVASTYHVELRYNDTASLYSILSISVYVSAGDDDPAPGIDVYLYRVSGGNLVLIGVNRTMGDGTCMLRVYLDELGVVSYAVRVGGTYRFINVTVRAGIGRLELSPRVIPYGESSRLALRVLDTMGRPVPGARFLLLVRRNGTQFFAGSGVTDRWGRVFFDIVWPRPGAYTVEAVPASPYVSLAADNVFRVSVVEGLQTDNVTLEDIYLLLMQVNETVSSGFNETLRVLSRLLDTVGFVGGNLTLINASIHEGFAQLTYMLSGVNSSIANITVTIHDMSRDLSELREIINLTETLYSLVESMNNSVAAAINSISVDLGRLNATITMHLDRLGENITGSLGGLSSALNDIAVLLEENVSAIKNFLERYGAAMLAVEENVSAIRLVLMNLSGGIEGFMEYISGLNATITALNDYIAVIRNNMTALYIRIDSLLDMLGNATTLMDKLYGFMENITRYADLLEEIAGILRNISRSIGGGGGNASLAYSPGGAYAAAGGDIVFYYISFIILAAAGTVNIVARLLRRASGGGRG